MTKTVPAGNDEKVRLLHVIYIFRPYRDLIRFGKSVPPFIAGIDECMVIVFGVKVRLPESDYLFLFPELCLFPPLRHRQPLTSSATMRLP